MKTKFVSCSFRLAILALSFGSSIASAQSTWTYDVTMPYGGSPPPDWFQNDTLGGNRIKTPPNYGFWSVGQPNAYGMAPAYNAGENGTHTLVHGLNSYDLADGLKMTMGWMPHPQHLQDDGFYADNEIMQMGLVGSTGSFMGISPALFLSAIEDTASLATGVTNSFLAIRTDSGIHDYFNGGNTYAFDIDHYYVFQMDFELFTPGDPGLVNVSLNMDVYAETVPYSAQYVYTNSVNFGTQYKIANPLAGDSTLYPAFGLTIRDATKVSISGANFDTPVAIPEPGSMALVLLSATAAMGIRRRR